MNDMLFEIYFKNLIKKNFLTLSFLSGHKGPFFFFLKLYFVKIIDYISVPASLGQFENFREKTCSGRKGLNNL